MHANFDYSDGAWLFWKWLFTIITAYESGMFTVKHHIQILNWAAASIKSISKSD